MFAKLAPTASDLFLGFVLLAVILCSLVSRIVLSDPRQSSCALNLRNCFSAIKLKSTRANPNDPVRPEVRKFKIEGPDALCPAGSRSRPLRRQSEGCRAAAIRYDATRHPRQPTSPVAHPSRAELVVQRGHAPHAVEIFSPAHPSCSIGRIAFYFLCWHCQGKSRRRVQDHAHNHLAATRADH
jgi:hypothetical protein